MTASTALLALIVALDEKVRKRQEADPDVQIWGAKGVGQPPPGMKWTDPATPEEEAAFDAEWAEAERGWTEAYGVKT